MKAVYPHVNLPSEDALAEFMGYKRNNKKCEIKSKKQGFLTLDPKRPHEA